MMFTKNYRLSRIYFGALTEFHVSQLVAVQNPGLGSLGLELHFLNTTDLLIAGNRDFNKKELANIRKMQMATNKVKAYIQKEGECSFSEEITDPLELEGCKSVKGDLILAKTFPGNVAGTPLVEVQGNVELGDTEHESLGFLAGTKVTGYICQLFSSSLVIFSISCFLWLINFKVRGKTAKNRCPMGKEDISFLVFGEI